MADTASTRRGIFALPNEILLDLFNLLPTSELFSLTPTCRQFHSLVLRLLHHRLQIASSLDGHSLYLDCHRPSDRSTKVNCTSLGTEGLQDLLSAIENESSYVGHLKSISSLYTRFRPRRQEPEFTVTYRHPAGDVPGSRTWRDPNDVPAVEEAIELDETVRQTVTVDAHDLFSQLSAQVWLGKSYPYHGLLFSKQGVSEGTIRVWRNWLSRQCERKSWTDGEVVVVHHEEQEGKGKTRADSVVGNTTDPRKDAGVLWINTSGDNVGVKFKVRERQRRNAPVLFASEEEVAVSYIVEFEEVIVRTTHLLFKLEEADALIQNQKGKAIVFGAFRG